MSFENADAGVASQTFIAVMITAAKLAVIITAARLAVIIIAARYSSNNKGSCCCIRRRRRRPRDEMLLKTAQVKHTQESRKAVTSYIYYYFTSYIFYYFTSHAYTQEATDASALARMHLERASNILTCHTLVTCSRTLHALTPHARTKQ